MMEKSDQIWNALLHYVKPLTDDPESESVIMSEDLNEVHKDIMAVIEGREVISAKVKKELPVRSQSSVERKVQDLPKIDKAIPEPVNVDGEKRSDELKKKPWWKVW